MVVTTLLLPLRSPWVTRAALTCAIFVASGAWAPAVACSCAFSGPPCQAYWNSDAVFDATVVKIEPATPEVLIGEQVIRHTMRRVTLNVTHAWKGVQTGTLQVVTNPDGASCGFDFKEGSRYLVFARRGQLSEIEVSRCSATRPFDGTGEAAAFLASLAGPGQGGRLFGTIHPQIRRVDGLAKPAPPPTDLLVTLTWQGQARTARAIAGKYEFSGLLPGTYQVSATAPEGYTASAWAAAPTIPNMHACAESNVSISYAGRISGQVIDGRGRGVPRVRVEIVGADISLPLESAQFVVDADNDGVFEPTGLAPGRYLAGLNLADLPSEYRPYPMTIYPGQDLPVQVIELGLGQVIDLGRWEIPATVPVVPLTGMIAWKDGTPAEGVRVLLWDVTGNPKSRLRGAGSTTSGQGGHFAIDARDGRTYAVEARVGDRQTVPIGAVRVSVRPDIRPLRIVIRQDPPR